MPRQKKTAPADPIADLGKAVAKLPDLTDQQHKFVLGLLNGETATASYRSAYNCENMQPATIWANASRLRSDAKVATWLDHARMIGLERAAVTYEGHVGELKRLGRVSEKTGNMGAAVQAEIHIGKATGLYVERHEHGIAPNTLDALERISRLAGDNVAQALARKHNVPWPKMIEGKVAET